VHADLTIGNTTRIEPKRQIGCDESLQVFRRICTKVILKSCKAELLNDAVIALCMLEKEFPLGFFNIMTYLMVHLVEELFICGPVHMRWMYLMERYMKFLKEYVRTKA
jgi:hypothetical protein